MILCSVSIAIMLRYNSSKGGNELVLLAGNYFTAGVISLFLLVLDPESTVSLSTVIFGAFMAVIFVCSFFSFAMAVSSSGAALAAVSARLSVIMPVGLSIIFFSEKLFLLRYLGIILTIVAVCFFYQSLKNQSGEHINKKRFYYLFILFLSIGTGDFGIKIFNEMMPSSDKSLFFLSIFGFSFIYCLTIILVKRIEIKYETAVRGMILGVPNLFSSFFLVGALQSLPAVVVYPVANVGIILLTTAAAAAIWREKLNIAGYAALLTGLAAICAFSAG